MSFNTNLIPYSCFQLFLGVFIVLTNCFQQCILKKLIVVHRSLAKKLYLCTRNALHVSAKIQSEDSAR